MNKTYQAMALLIAKDYLKRPDTFYGVLKNLLVNDLFELMGEEKDMAKVEREKFHIKGLLNDLAFLLSGNIIESRHAKKILEDAWDTEPYAWDMCWYLSDSKILDEVSGDDLGIIVSRIVEANPKVKEDILKGKKQAIGFFVGQVMKETKGKTDPNEVKKEIEKYLKI